MKIGEFARLGHVSVRMLRHYESLGLLLPEETDPWTGHRNYSVAQLALLNRIMALNALGIPLRQVIEMLDSDLDSRQLGDLLRLRHQQLETESTEIAAKIAEVDFRLALIERNVMITADCIIKDLPADRICGTSTQLGRPPYDAEEIGPLFTEVATRISRFGGDPLIGVGLYADTDTGTEVTVGYRSTITEAVADQSGLIVVELPPVRAVTLVHQGPMSHVGASWQTLVEWCSSQNYALAGPCREVYLEAGDGRDDSDQSDWVVELQLPITADERLS